MIRENAPGEDYLYINSNIYSCFLQEKHSQINDNQRISET